MAVGVPQSWPEGTPVLGYPPIRTSDRAGYPLGSTCDGTGVPPERDTEPETGVPPEGTWDQRLGIPQ